MQYGSGKQEKIYKILVKDNIANSTLFNASVFTNPYTGAPTFNGNSYSWYYQTFNYGQALYVNSGKTIWGSSSLGDFASFQIDPNKIYKVVFDFTMNLSISSGNSSLITGRGISLVDESFNIVSDSDYTGIGTKNFKGNYTIGPGFAGIWLTQFGTSASATITGVSVTATFKDFYIVEV